MHHHFEKAGWDESCVVIRFWIIADHICAFQPQHAQAALMDRNMERSYAGQKVLVVGAARSGMASAEFLLKRGARVVLTDIKSRTCWRLPRPVARGWHRSPEI